jgi:beta-glucosidase
MKHAAARHTRSRRRSRLRTAGAAVACAIAMAIAYAGTAQATPQAIPRAASRAASRPAEPIYLNPHYSYAERAADLVSRMTLAEKLQQFSTGDNHFNTPSPAIPRLGVEQYTYWNEALHGVYYLGNNTNGDGTSQSAKATSYPVNLAATMSWNPQLVYQEGSAIAQEARGFVDPSLWGSGQNNLGPSPSDYGALTYFAPTVNMDRDPRWGRADETYGEDPYLASQMAGQFVNGIQGQSMTGQSLTGYLEVAATAKHFLMNNEEDDRTTGSSDTTDANIRDYYTAQFRALTEDDHVAGVMTSYNAVNGTPSPDDTYTANELLQRTYGFNGYTTSDCNAVNTAYASDGHDWAPPGWTTNGQTWTNTATGQQIPASAGSEAWALRAGTQLECTAASPSALQDALNDGVLSQGVIDNALVHIFTMRMETGEFNPRSTVPYTKITSSVIQDPDHQALARELADEDLVLLQNNDVAGTSHPLLPVNPAKLNNVVIVGNLANTMTLGDYSGSPSYTTTPVQGITDAVKAANPGANVIFDSCGTSTTATTPASCSAATLAAMKTASLVIVFTGTDLSVGTEGHDRSSLAMPGNYDSLISQVAAVGNPDTALVIQSDGPVDISNVQQDFPAIVFSAYNGQAQGQALADVLTGARNPSGHLDFTWYTDDSQLPDISNYGLTPSQTSGLGRTYMYFTGTPTYPFGYGLSYTTFRYSGVRASAPKINANGTVNVSFTVTNTGSTPGATVAQLYAAAQFTVPGMELPGKQLVGFQRTRVLAPGHSQRITLKASATQLEEWDENALKQVVYDGPYQFQVSSDASAVQGARTVDITGAITPKVQYVTVQPDQVIFTPGQVLNLTGNNPWLADDTDLSLQQPHASATNVVEAVNNDESFVNLADTKVTYSSNDPSVASVSPDGVVTMNAPGAATISATVHGVSGSTPIVVQAPLTATAPSNTVAGTTTTATETFSNPGSKPLTNVAVTLTGPSGWTVAPASPTTFSTLAPGQTITTTWNVTIPADTASGSYELPANATFTASDGPGSSSSAASTSVLSEFTITPSTSEVIIPLGGSNKISYQVTNNTASALQVELAAQAPDGVTATPAATTLSLAAGESAQVTLQLSNNSQSSGTAPFVVVGSTAGVTVSSSVTLQYLANDLAFNPGGAPYPAAFASSSQAAFPPSLAIDGNPNTFWVSGGPAAAGDGPTPQNPVVLGVDFGAPVTVGTVTMVPRTSYGPSAYSVQVSNDDQTWTTIADVPSAANGTVTTSFTPVTARYLRLLITGSWDATDRNVQVAELEPGAP